MLQFKLQSALTAHLNLFAAHVENGAPFCNVCNVIGESGPQALPASVHCKFACNSANCL